MITVRCIETGKCYPSVASAARDAGVAPQTLHDALRFNTQVGGQRYEVIARHSPKYDNGGPYWNNSSGPVMDSEGRCYASLAEAAREKGLSRRQARKIYHRV